MYTMNKTNIYIASYNILADHYCSNEIFPFSEKGATDVDKRRKLLKKELLSLMNISSNKKVILCLQEMSNNQFDDLELWFLNNNYDSIYFPNEINYGGNLGVCICYPTNKYNILKIKRYVIEDNTKLIRKSIAYFLNTTRKHLLLVKIKDKESDKPFIVGTTHLSADPKITDVKLWQAGICCRLIKEFNKDKLPIILAGDFNSLPESSVYYFITNGKVKKDDENRLPIPEELYEHNLNLTSSMKKINGQEPEFTNYAHQARNEKIFIGTLDYIFVSPEFKISKALPIPKLSIIKKKYKSFPSKSHSSDHIPILVKLTL